MNASLTGPKIKISKIVLTAVFVALGISFLLPLLWMISSSMKVESDVFKFPIEWIPKTWNALQNYSEVWGPNYNFGLYYLNSIKITVFSTIFQGLVAALGAYAFVVLNFKGKNLLFMLYLATMMIPSQVTVVPQFVIMRSLGLYNTHLGVIVLMVFSVYGVFLLRQAIMAVPPSLIEAAKIDGASHLRIFSQIVLPMIQPSLVTLAIIKFIWTWNDYQTALIFLSSRELFTIPLGMQQFASQTGTFYSLIMVASVSATLPLILVFLFGQRFIIEGMTAGAVKG